MRNKAPGEGVCLGDIKGVMILFIFFSEKGQFWKWNYSAEQKWPDARVV